MMSASSSLYQGDFIPVSHAIASHPGAAMLTERPISLPESAFLIPQFAFQETFSLPLPSLLLKLPRRRKV